MLDRALVSQFRALAAEGGEVDTSDLAPLGSELEVLAWVIAETRARGEINEADAVELVLLDTNSSRDELRSWAQSLKRLGYVGVSNRLRLMARRAKAKPLPVRLGRRRPRSA
ncbi:hypothetical protein [Bradyrhizobium guangzhouense]|uniref:hypothetical protein n=1 Tax=Bradyrhizobium guangzhouense TaxID=1325095 RepID=UPI001009E81C|nr:hypothetical protein [Bradyrhizobium guangzhouense]RXH15232.1 hypothetical protein EAS54_19340 [Bradyrhizobium guangzhouense]